MIRSMTGYGAAESEGPQGRFRAELRGVNGRFLEIRLRVPPALTAFESDLRRRLGESFRRGRLDLLLTWEPSEGGDSPVKLHAGLAKAYLEAAIRLRSELGLVGELGVVELLSLPGVVETARGEKADGALWNLAKAAVDEAVREVEGMRRAEGEALAMDIQARLRRLEDLRDRVASRAQEIPAAAQKRLQERLGRLGVEASLDPGRLAQEVAYIADKSDIAEELARIEAHVTRCRELLAKTDEPVGKSLEFLTQELHREVNTIGSKSTAIEITQSVLEMKTEIERVREQVMNLE